MSQITRPEEGASAPATQKSGFEQHYENIYSAALEKGEHGRSSSPLRRFLRERRLRIAVSRLLKLTGSKPGDWNALVVCAGNGIEGSFLADAGFREVTISDFSETGLSWGKSLDHRLKTQLLDAEKMDLPNNSYDLVIVQDGLHHLPGPPAGLTEMLRVAKRGVIVIEPHVGIVSRLFGATWERTDLAVNYVFRWNKWLFSSVVQSYLLLGSETAEVAARTPVDPRKPYRLDYNLKDGCSYRIDTIRLWDHHEAMQKLAGLLGSGRFALMGAQAAYGCCTCFLPGLGNMFIGIVVKQDS